MFRPNQEAIDTFISITGASDAVARRKLEEYNGDLNAAVNSHFSEEDRNGVHQTSFASHQDEHLDIDDPNPMEVATTRNPLSPILEASVENPFSLLDRLFRQSLFARSSHFTGRAPFVSLPREVREIPIEEKDSGDVPSRSAHAPVIEDVTETEVEHGSGTHGTVVIADEDDDNISDVMTTMEARRNQHLGVSDFKELPDYSNAMEEEMIRAAIEASKRDTQKLSNPGPPQQHLEDAELAHAVSLSLKTAEEEKALRDQKEKVGGLGVNDCNEAEVESGTKVASNRRFVTGSSSFQDEDSDAEDQPLVRHRSRHTSIG